MKYMGSKRFMLANGFGEAIVEQAARADRVVDLFAGSGAVAWFAAENTGKPVHAYDLQHYSAVLSRAVVSRTKKADPDRLRASWVQSVRRAVRRSRLHRVAAANSSALTPDEVYAARDLCRAEPGRGPIWNAYGGHYFSPMQALTLDLALAHLPERNTDRALCHAAVVVAASYCAAAPGHTAQPFQPTPTALTYVADAWRRDPLRKIEEWLSNMANRHARRVGRARVSDALTQAKHLTPNDLVIVDPPYSAVQYSRFYHVLETVARQECPSVDGVGRYPPPTDRPSSMFSLKTQSERATSQLLGTLADAGSQVLLTFPAGESSNGLSGGRIVQLAQERFQVSAKTVLGRFSTLGGNNAVRASRQASAELILGLTPR